MGFRISNRWLLAWALVLGCWPMLPAQGPATGDRDRVLAIQIELGWLADPAVCRFSPSAQVEGEMLHIYGFVPNDSLRAKILDIAQGHTKLKVVDKLKINPALTFPPVHVPGSQLLRNCALALKTGFPKDYQHWQIGMHGEGGLVVAGTVGSLEEKLIISRKLSTITGCNCVENRMEVIPGLKSAQTTTARVGTEKTPLAPKADNLAAAAAAKPALPAPPANWVKSSSTGKPASPALVAPPPLTAPPSVMSAGLPAPPVLAAPPSTSPYAPSATYQGSAASPYAPSAKAPSNGWVTNSSVASASPYAGSQKSGQAVSLPGPPSPYAQSEPSWSPALPGQGSMKIAAAPAPTNMTTAKVTPLGSNSVAGANTSVCLVSHTQPVAKPAVPVPPAVPPATTQNAVLAEAIRKACGSKLRELKVELKGNTLAVRFAATSESDAERLADVILYHVPELARFAVELEVEVPKS